MSLLRLEGIQLQNLKNRFILDNFHLEISHQSIHCLVGPSGSGKSTLAGLILGILPKGWKLSYKSWLSLDEVSDLVESRENPPPSFLERQRGKQIGFIPQSPAMALHPYRTIGDQAREFTLWISGKKTSEKDFFPLWEELGLHHLERVWNSRPHKLSGGERQRIAMSFVSLDPPPLVLADEPTSALDPASEEALLQSMLLLKEKGTSILLITHNPKIVRKFADKVTVMESGKEVETLNRTGEGFHSKHPLSQILIGEVSAFAPTVPTASP